MKNLPLFLSCLVFVSGCGTRGYITSTVSTVIGLEVGENPKTQVPHVRFGYVRGQYYYIPTDKVAGEVDGRSGSAKDTPTLVSNLYVTSKFLSGMTISEQFAVGQNALNSGAATNAFGAAAPTQALADNPEAAGTIPEFVQKAINVPARQVVVVQNAPVVPPYAKNVDVKRFRIQLLEIYKRIPPDKLDEVNREATEKFGYAFVYLTEPFKNAERRAEAEEFAKTISARFAKTSSPVSPTPTPGLAPTPAIPEPPLPVESPTPG